MSNANNNLRRIVRGTDFDWENPEKIDMSWLEEDRKILHEILERLYPDCEIDKLVFLYQHYDFLENQIHQFLEADSALYDKSDWIMKQYFEKLVGGVPDELEGYWYDPECVGRKCTEPEFGTTDDWMEFVDAMIDLYRNGMTDKAIFAFKYIRIKYEEYRNR